MENHNFIIELKENLITEKYKYPKVLLDKIFGKDLIIGNSSKKIESHVSFLSHNLSLPEQFFSDSQYILNIQNEAPDLLNTTKKMTLLELRNDNKEPQVKTSTSKNRKEGQIALEDWLEEVL